MLLNIRKHNKKYEYSENKKIDRTNHTYLDYLSYIHKNPRVNVWQLDFLGAIKTDSKSILSFILPEVHFTLLDIITNPNSSKIVKFFDDLEETIGTDGFIELIPVILTDRDPCISNQKPNVENINKQIRKFFPKGKSIDYLSKSNVLKII